MPEGGVKAFSQAEKHIAEIAQLVEHNLAKVEVAGPSPVFRSWQTSDNQWIVTRFFFFCRVLQMSDV